MAKRQQPQTTSGNLSDIARHVVLPSGITSTGWPAVRDTCKNLDIEFDPWQHGAGRAILAKDRHGIYAATVGGVVISIPRQVGKTFLIGAIIFALCVIHPGLTVIWTAHRFRTADETFESMRSMTKMKNIAGHIEKVTAGAGDQAVWFTNGSRILFGARESGFGRGFSEVDILVFDEAQILTERAINDMVPAQNASKNALTLFIGTPPQPTDPSEVFTNRRTEALSGESEGTVYIEFSADAGADLDDRAQWRKANPSYPHRTSEAAMLRMRKNLGEDSFRREALGVWDDLLGQSVIRKDVWADLAVDEVPNVPVAAYGIDMNPERTVATVAVGLRTESGVHVEVAELGAISGETDALVEWIVKRAGRRIPVVMDAFSPARSLEPILKQRKVKVFALSGSELMQACGGFYDAVTKDKALTHFDQEPLNVSLAGARKQKLGDAGGWKWSRKTLDVDLTPLVAVTAAHYGVVKFSKIRKSGETPGGKVVIL